MPVAAAPWTTVPTRFRKLLHPMTLGLVTFNDGHNKGSYTGASFTTALATWAGMVRAQFDSGPLQRRRKPQNDRQHGAAGQRAYLPVRMGQGRAAQNGVLTSNAMSAFYADPRGPAVLVSNDEAHPV